MSKKTEEQQHDLQHEITTKRPTVEELLKMLSGGSSSSNRPSPPPLPPKPKPGFEMSIEAAKRSLGLLPDSKKISSTKLPEDNTPANRTFVVNSCGGDDVIPTKLTPDPIEKHDISAHPNLAVSSSRNTQLDGYYENNHPPVSAAAAPATLATKITASHRTKTSPYGGSVVYISSSSPSVPAIPQHTDDIPSPLQQQTSPATKSNGGYKSHRTSTRTSRPIVTELSDTETNNNNLIGHQQHKILAHTKNNASTVEILELPSVSGVQDSSSHDIHGYHSAIASTGGNKQEQATRGQQYSNSPRAHCVGGTAFAPTNLVIVSTTGHNKASSDGCNDYCHNANGAGGDDDIQLANEVETILSNSLSGRGGGNNDQPPRTSTPTPTAELLKRQYQRADSATNSSSGASTETNNNNNYLNRSSHLHNANYISQTSTSPKQIDINNLPSDDNDDIDMLNISRETDELTNTSVHNQSGCELVGVNDNSDPKDITPRKIESTQQAETGTSQQETTTPYTVQFLNDTLLSPSGSSSSPPEHSNNNNRNKNNNKNINKNNNNNNSQKSSTEALNDNSIKLSRAYEMSIHELESNNLRKLVNTLQEQIEKLNNKVSGLTNKVDDLESELDRQKRNEDGAAIRGAKSTASIFVSASNERSRLESASYHQSPMGTMQKLSPLSQSVSTINKITPLKTSGNKHNTSYGFTSSTYSRNGQTQKPSPVNASNLLSAKRSQAHLNQSYSGAGSMSRSGTQSRKPNNMHTSTSSLYADSNRSPGSASISPTPNDGSTINNRAHTSGRDCYASPSSSYLTNSQARRAGDATPSAYNSMLSLTSAGNSTLRGGASMAGSVSNLSQFGTGTATASQLVNWPSMSNFITTKHQAKDILYDEEEQVIRMILYNTLITMRVPTWLGQDYCLDRIIEAPAVKLKLDWVHGYRGRDCRSNIYYLPTGECVYFVASVVILYNPEEKTQRHYLGHTDSVKCLAVHPNKLIVASGQSAIANRRDKRPIVRVWNTVSLATIRVIGFNEDFDRSICCLAFSKHDAGATLAVVDESSEHTITLLDWQREKNWRVAEANSGHEPVLAIDFHPIDKYSLVAVGKSSINFWDIRGMTLAKKAGLFDKYDRPKYCLCMTFNDLGETITGDSNGNIIIWPRGTNKPRRIIRDAHPGGVFSVLAMKDGSYLTGGRDRRIIEWDESFESTGRQAELPEHCGGVRFITCARGAQVLIGTLRNSILLGSLDPAGFQIIVQGHTEATTALAVHPSLPKYLTGGFDDQIHFLDAQTHTLEWSKCLAMPITAASFSPNGQILILGSISGSWLALDAITQEILFTACDGTGTINCIKFSPDGQLFAMGSSDCHAYIYQTTPSGNTFCRLGTCVGHSAPVKEIDWSDDSAYLQTQSMNIELLFWKAHTCRPVDSGDDLVHDLKWTTHNCTIGFNVIGIWSDSIDSALINYCDKSNNDKYIVSATDTGFLNIYKWPTYYNQCSSQKYYGNVDKFTYVKFLSDDSRLIGVDAKSCATTEWSIIEDED